MSRITDLESILSQDLFNNQKDQAEIINELSVIIAVYGDFE